MAKSSVEVWLWLLLVMQPYNSKTNYILSQCGYDASRAAREIRDGKYPFLGENEKKRAGQVRNGAIKQVMKTCFDNNIRIITLDDEEYPALLRHIENPPIVLFVCGSLSGLDKRLTISAVGARNVSEYGQKAADNICGPLSRLGTVIVSGLAVGADAAAHRASLNNGGRTVGVLGCGMLVNYPAENAQLKRDIVANGGAIISELLPNAKTFGGYFPQRNRIISGLSLGTLVIEASERSGSLLTANHALEQGREVFCIPPHDIFSMRYAGAAQLLREGAVPVFNYTDIVNRFLPYFSDSDYLKNLLEKMEAEPPVYNEPKAPRKKKKSDEASVGPAVESAAGEIKKEPPGDDILSTLEPNEAAVLKLISQKSADMDALLEESGFEYSALAEALTNLELYGYITRGMDGIYLLT